MFLVIGQVIKHWSTRSHMLRIISTIELHYIDPMAANTNKLINKLPVVTFFERTNWIVISFHENLVIRIIIDCFWILVNLIVTQVHWCLRAPYWHLRKIAFQGGKLFFTNSRFIIASYQLRVPDCNLWNLCFLYRNFAFVGIIFAVSVLYFERYFAIFINMTPRGIEPMYSSGSI